MPLAPCGLKALWLDTSQCYRPLSFDVWIKPLCTLAFHSKATDSWPVIWSFWSADARLIDNRPDKLSSQANESGLVFTVFRILTLSNNMIMNGVNDIILGAEAYLLQFCWHPKSTSGLAVKTIRQTIRVLGGGIMYNFIFQMSDIKYSVSQ